MEHLAIETTRPEVAKLPLLYDRIEAASTLKIGLRTLDRIIARGELATVEIGGRTLISSLEILSFIERQTIRRECPASRHVEEIAV